MKHEPWRGRSTGKAPAVLGKAAAGVLAMSAAVKCRAISCSVGGAGDASVEVPINSSNSGSGIFVSACII